MSRQVIEEENTMENENWAQAENPEVEAAKDAYTEAQHAEKLRAKITEYATAAVQHGVDQEWANTWLNRLGAKPVTVLARYRINIPVTGLYGRTITAGSRTEAVELFNRHLTRVSAAGRIGDGSSYDRVYRATFADVPPTFASGPEDPTETDDAVPGFEALRSEIRKMLKEGVTDRGWGWRYAVRALADMAVDPLPALANRTVTVPVTGTARLVVLAFEGDTDQDLQNAVVAKLAETEFATVRLDEIGDAVADPAGAPDLGEDPF